MCGSRPFLTRHRCSLHSSGPERVAEGRGSLRLYGSWGRVSCASDRRDWSGWGISFSSREKGACHKAHLSRPASDSSHGREGRYNAVQGGLASSRRQPVPGRPCMRAPHACEYKHLSRRQTIVSDPLFAGWSEWSSATRPARKTDALLLHWPPKKQK